MREGGEMGMSDQTKVEFIESYIKIGNSHYKWNDNHGELIRCNDCKWRGTYQCPIYIGGDGMRGRPDDWFCADGKRKKEHDDQSI